MQEPAQQTEGFPVQGINQLVTSNKKLEELVTSNKLTSLEIKHRYRDWETLQIGRAHV